MKPENKEFLDKHRHHYDTVIKAGYVKHLNAHEREGMQRVMREEFQPGYTADLWCPPCLFDMVKQLYQRYDNWLAAQMIEEPQPIENTLGEVEPVNPLNIKDDEPHSPNSENPPHGDNRPKRNRRRR
jgi:hypothetical protein